MMPRKSSMGLKTLALIITWGLVAAVAISWTQGFFGLMDIEQGIYGRVLIGSDIAGRDATSNRGALVLAMRQSELNKARQAAGYEGDYGGPSSVLISKLPKPVFEEYVAGYTYSGWWNGSYRLSLPPGNYLLCLADPHRDWLPGVSAAELRGCGEVTIATEEAVQKNIVTGFAGAVSIE